MEDDFTTGAPVAMYIPNTDIEDEQIEKHRSYKHMVRPGQAAYTYLKKYGDHADWYGAGRASGRETAARVAGGAVAGRILEHLGINVIAYIKEIHNVCASDISYETAVKNYRKNIVNCPDLGAAEKMIEEIIKAKEEGDTLGGIIEVIAANVPAGIGEPVFDKLQAMLSHALLSIGAIKGIEFGAGFMMTKMKGSQANDTPYFKNDDSKVYFKTNNAGGILGGISNGEEIRIRLAIKPTPTIQKEQWTVDTNERKNIKVSYSTRNDPCICPRIYPVCEAMTKIVLVDAIMTANGYGSLVRVGDKWTVL
jgi:chorismate synthase